MANSNLHKAKTAKNDEFYTQLSDIEKELPHYRKHFAGKIVYCNCDNPEWSAFWEYFHAHFAELGLKKLVSTHYEEEGQSYRMDYEGGNDSDLKSGNIVPLKGNGDFRSKECEALLNECDIVVTNPPFSIGPKYFITQLMKHNKPFLIIGDLTWITSFYVFPLIAENKVWLGYNAVKEFRQPDGSIAKFGNKLWFTNLEHGKRNEKLVLKKTYDADRYYSYINYDAINVGHVNDIPCDYDGLMGVPLTFLNSYNPEQFEIIGCPQYNGPYGRDDIGLKRIGDEWLRRYKEQGGTGHYTANMTVLAYFDKEGKAKSPFSKIIIKRRVAE